MIRKIDYLGRIVIPMEMRKSLGIKDNDDLIMSLGKDSIIIKKAKTSDIEIFIASLLKNEQDNHTREILEEILKEMEE